MRKFKRFTPQCLALRLLLFSASALLLLAAFAPRASAQCTNCLIRYYNFEGAATPPYTVNLFSNPPAFETGLNTNLTLKGTDPPGAPFPTANQVIGPEIPLNLAGPPGTRSLGIIRSAQTNLNIDIPFFSVVGIYDITSVSFAYGANGNGYSAVQLQMSTDGGVTFSNLSGVVALPATPGSVVMFSITPGTTLNIPTLVLRLSFTGGQSNGVDLQNEIDNIQINGTVLPEPSTVAAGLLGVLGLCWFQRKRLIRSVRFRRT